MQPERDRGDLEFISGLHFRASSGLLRVIIRVSGFVLRVRGFGVHFQVRATQGRLPGSRVSCSGFGDYRDIIRPETQQQLRKTDPRPSRQTDQQTQIQTKQPVDAGQTDQRLNPIFRLARQAAVYSLSADCQQHKPTPLMSTDKTSQTTRTQQLMR